ncbi:hypothetical protein GUI12_02835 [Anaplasmataceae bacterium AB001_6]|nr:hypothetical protein GUI12_02835 [Anaplasmataceae bacterium AB001_6]
MEIKKITFLLKIKKNELAKYISVLEIKNDELNKLILIKNGLEEKIKDNNKYLDYNNYKLSEIFKEYLIYLDKLIKKTNQEIAYKEIDITVILHTLRKKHGYIKCLEKLIENRIKSIKAYNTKKNMEKYDNIFSNKLYLDKKNAKL